MPTQLYASVNGTRLCYFERGERTDTRPSLLFAHCTGFHARVWDFIIDQLPDQHTIALDLRGHGRSEGEPVTTWRTFSDDIATFLAELNLQHVIGIGHSMGAHAMVGAEASAGRFASLVLCDPTIAAPEAYGAPADPSKASVIDQIAKRRSRFNSPAAMRDRLLGRGSYSLFESKMLDDYCEHGLIATGEGDYRLACDPTFEASVYRAARACTGIYESVRALTIPVHILRAKTPPPGPRKMDFTTSPTWPKLVEQFQHGSEEWLEDCSHFIPMQMPDKVLAATQRAIEAWRRVYAVEKCAPTGSPALKRRLGPAKSADSDKGQLA